MNTLRTLRSIAQLRERIAAENDRLNIFCDLSPNPGEAPNSSIHGRFHGIAVAVKSNIAVAGLPHTAGIAGFASRVAMADAFAVDLLRRNGATILGTVNMEEAALGAITNNPHFGRTHNPHRFGLTPGGSSGGSAAAVAAGMAHVALGTDTMGSCRIPAAYCGVVGYKPSFGRISVGTVEPLSNRLDHVGILGESLAVVEAVATQLSMVDRNCAHSIDYGDWTVAAPPANPLRLAVLDAQTIEACEPTVAHAYRALLERLRNAGHTLNERCVDKSALASARRAGLLICEAELANSLRGLLDGPIGGVSTQLRKMIAFAESKSAPSLAHAHAVVDDMIVLERGLMEGVDALVWPTAPQTAFAFDAPVPHDQADFSCLANFTGSPAISLPLTVARGALPVGLQLMTPRGSDARLFSLATQLQPSL